MGLSQYSAQNLLDLMLGGQAFTPAGTLYMALFLSAPSMTGGGVEVPTSGTGYARVAIANNLTSGWQGATSGVPPLKQNSGAIVFPTATGPWGTVGFVALFDAATNGNLYVFASLVTPISITSGMTFGFNNPGDFAFGLQ